MDRTEVMVTFINGISLTGRAIENPNAVDQSQWEAEEYALEWLLNDDPLQLSPDTPYHQFRIQQRYALLTLWFQPRTLLLLQ